MRRPCGNKHGGTVVGVLRVPFAAAVPVTKGQRPAVAAMGFQVRQAVTIDRSRRRGRCGDLPAAVECC